MAQRSFGWRVSLLNLMLAVAVLSLTLALTRPRTEIWPTYQAVSWIAARAPNHDPATHAAISEDLTSPAVIRDALADPRVSGLHQIRRALNPREEIVRNLHIDIHPRDRGARNPKIEAIRVAIESPSPIEAALVRDAVVDAYLKNQASAKILRVTPVRPERVAHPIFDRPWKFRVALVSGLSLSLVVLFIPLGRHNKFVRRALGALAVIGTVFGAVVWWLLTHPESYFEISGYRFF